MDQKVTSRVKGKAGQTPSQTLLKYGFRTSEGQNNGYFGFSQKKYLCLLTDPSEPNVSRDLENQTDSAQQDCDSENAALTGNAVVLNEKETIKENGKIGHSQNKKLLCLLTDQSEAVQGIENSVNAALSDAGIQSQ